MLTVAHCRIEFNLAHAPRLPFATAFTLATIPSTQRVHW